MTMMGGTVQHTIYTWNYYKYYCEENRIEYKIIVIDILWSTQINVPYIN